MVKLFVEGGGDNKVLRNECRDGFATFITKAGLKKRPRIVACGTRRNAYESFCTEIANGEEAFLLVDSEDAVDAKHQQKPWAHLKARKGDEWNKPDGATDTQCHLMVQVMESWFLADWEESKAIESISKKEVYDILEKRMKKMKGESYSKGKHSFKLLAKIDPAKVTEASPWANRLIEELKKKLDATPP